jgi:glucose dehydrogenase
MRLNRGVWTLCLYLTVTTSIFSLSILAQGKKSKSGEWVNFGRDKAGSHYNPEENSITPTNVSQLKVKWTFEAGDDISSEPIVANGIVYFGSWDGKEYALDAKTGQKIWEFDCGQSSRAAAAYRFRRHRRILARAGCQNRHGEMEEAH